MAHVDKFQQNVDGSKPLFQNIAFEAEMILRPGLRVLRLWDRGMPTSGACGQNSFSNVFSRSRQKLLVNPGGAVKESACRACDAEQTGIE